jgi:hypothetical protein
MNIGSDVALRMNYSCRQESETACGGQRQILFMRKAWMQCVLRSDGMYIVIE